MKKIWFHKYEVLRLLGQGGTGKVYLVRDMHLNRLAAVKESRDSFLQSETAILKKLDHPGLPGIYDCFKQGDSTFLVMEYIEGMTLRQYLDKHGKVTERQAVRWMMELCGILGYLHGRSPKVIYRDLKPENIMIRQDGRLKLIDLGTAVNDFGGEGQEGFWAGTAGYSPPEQWKETRGDVTWDIFGAGAVFHEMLTGISPARPPYERRPLGEYDRSLSKSLNKIIKTCTDRNPSDRYQSVKEIETALLHYHEPFPLSKMWWVLKKSIVASAAAYTAFCFLAPLLQGIPGNQIPFPYLEKPLFLLMITLLLFLLFLGRKSRLQFMQKQEKNIWLTEKQFSGLLSLLLFLLAGTWNPGQAADPPFTVCAWEEQEKLWVEMRDSQWRKMLLKEDAVLKTWAPVRFEIPPERLPDQELSMQLIATGEDGSMYTSRIFKVHPTPP
ncbi:MAG: serine/threonine protein kinase [Lachnospiraceae bacterium]|nr:serine/threonine protein kinase [Lachnospiraceae bacterium]